MTFNLLERLGTMLGRSAAERYYGDPTAWPRIFEANRDQLDNPDLIHPGQVLRIPA